MLYMVIERYRSGPGPVYERAAARGRMLPDGLRYVSSWVAAATMDRCFQLMETDDVTLFQRWIADWQELVEFEVIPVVEGKTTRAALEPML